MYLSLEIWKKCQFSSLKFENFKTPTIRKYWSDQANEGRIVGCVRARYVNPTPADLGGVTSILYELEHRYKYSFLGFF